MNNGIDYIATHNFDSYISDNNGNCGSIGTLTSKCDYCDVTDTILDWYTYGAHTWNAVLSDTPAQDALYEYRLFCKKCNNTAIKQLPGLFFSDVFVPLQNTISIRCKIKKNLFGEEFQDPYVSCCINNKEFTQTDFLEENGHYVFDFDNITSEEIGETASVTLYAFHDGVNYIGETTYITIEESTSVNWSLSLGDNISVNFYVPIDESLLNDTTITLTLKDKILSSSAVNASQHQNGSYIFNMNVPAAQMTDVITLKVISGNKHFTKEYSITQYANSILSDNYNEATKTLVKSMLNYGAASQKYFNYNIDSLANEGISSEVTYKVPESTADMIVNGRINGINFYGASLVYRDRIAVRYYFTGNVTSYTFTANGNTYTPIAKDGMFYVEIPDILPQNLDQQITLSVADTEGNSMSVTYGPMNYIVRMYHGEGSDSLKDLLRALYVYHKAAKEYTVGNKENDNVYEGDRD